MSWTPGEVINSSVRLKRLSGSIPSSYTVFPMDSRYYVECNIPDGLDFNSDSASQAIQWALDIGGNIALKDTFEIDETLQVSPSTRLKGPATLKWVGSTATYDGDPVIMMEIKDKDNNNTAKKDIELNDITFNANSKASYCVDFKTKGTIVSDIMVKNSKFYNWIPNVNESIACMVGASAYVQNKGNHLVIEDCYAYGNNNTHNRMYSFCIDGGNEASKRTRLGEINRCVVEKTYWGPTVGYCDEAKINHCVTIDVYTTKPTAYTTFATLEDFYAYNSTGDGIHLDCACNIEIKSPKILQGSAGECIAIDGQYEPANSVNVSIIGGLLFPYDSKKGIDIYKADNVKISDLTIDGLELATRGINPRSSNHLQLNNVTVTGCGEGIKEEGTTDYTTIIGSQFRDNGVNYIVTGSHSHITKSWDDDTWID